MDFYKELEELRSLFNSALTANWAMWGKVNYTNKEEYIKFLKGRELVNLSEKAFWNKLNSIEQTLIEEKTK